MERLRLDSFRLKLIAMVTMVIDHVGYVFYPELGWMRLIGRMAFPIYCFLLVEGFYHTSNVKKYMGRLAVFAILSEFPFDLMANAGGDYFAGQNIFFTLLLGLMAIYFIDEFEKMYRMSYFSKTMFNVLIAIVFSSIAMLLKTDYSALGVFYIVIFYLYRGRPLFIFLCIEIITIYFYGGIYGQRQMNSQNFAGFAVLFTALYNGKQGPKIKYVFYAFYPVHLLVIVGIYCMMYGRLPGR